MTDENTSNPQETSFVEALAESFAHEEIQVGQLVSGEIVAVTGDVALISVGGKTEAVMDRTELGELRPGDNLDAVVVAVTPEFRVSHRLAIERREREALRGAFANEVPVEGKVSGRNKGGYDISIAGIRAFCPMSQIDLAFPRNVDAYLGQTFLFRITELAEDLSSMVVSRAAVLKEERAQQAEQAWSKIEVGAEVEGEVKSIRDFGVFVDLGGVDGMVHVSELSHRFGVRPTEIARIGDTVRVKILEADRDKDRIALSIKALEPDPWVEAAQRFAAGSAFEGAVARKTDFGVFIELIPGVDGLLHVSQLPPGMQSDDPAFERGATVSGWVKDFDVNKRRISLTMREPAQGDPWADAAERYSTGTLVEGVVDRVAAFGVFIELEPGLTALLPASETDVPRGTDLSTRFTPGTRVSAAVLSVDPERKRISLSVKKGKESKASKEFRRWSEQRQQSERKQEVTAFGAALLQALKGEEK